MVMKASPAPAFEVIQADLLLEFLVVAFDAPAEFRQSDELFAWRVGRQSGEPGLGGGRLAARPLDDQPLHLSSAIAPLVSMSRADPHACEPRTHGATIALPPSDRLPGRIGQRFRQGMDRDRMSTLAASDQSRRAPPATIRWWPRRLRARPPGRRLTGDP